MTSEVTFGLFDRSLVGPVQSRVAVSGWQTAGGHDGGGLRAAGEEKGQGNPALTPRAERVQAR